MPPVTFRYLTGLRRALFRNARLTGSWDTAGRFASDWSTTPMTLDRAEDGCPCFVATVAFDGSAVGTTFRWGVTLDGPQGANLWGIPTEIQDMNSTSRYRTFVLGPDSPDAAQQQDFYLTYGQRLGAQRYFTRGSTAPHLRFAVWAPNALAVDVVFGKADNGYISDDGFGIDPGRPVVPLKGGADGIWHSEILPDFEAFDGVPYMYRIRNGQGHTVYRTDLFARNQIGRGSHDPPGTSACCRRWAYGSAQRPSPDSVNPAQSSSPAVHEGAVASAARTNRRQKRAAEIFLAEGMARADNPLHAAPDAKGARAGPSGVAGSTRCLICVSGANRRVVRMGQPVVHFEIGCRDHSPDAHTRTSPSSSTST